MVDVQPKSLDQLQANGLGGFAVASAFQSSTSSSHIQSQQQQQQFMSSNSNYSFTSALRRPSFFTDSPSSYQLQSFSQPFSPLLLPQTGNSTAFPSNDQVVAVAVAAGLAQQNQNGQFLRQSTSISEQEEASPYQINPTPKSFIASFEPNSPQSSIITPSQRSMLNLLQQQLQHKQMQRYQQEKALLQQQQMNFTQQALQQQQILLQTQANDNHFRSHLHQTEAVASMSLQPIPKVIQHCPNVPLQFTSAITTETDNFASAYSPIAASMLINNGVYSQQQQQNISQTEQQPLQLLQPTQVHPTSLSFPITAVNSITSVQPTQQPQQILLFPTMYGSNTTTNNCNNNNISQLSPSILRFINQSACQQNHSSQNVNTHQAIQRSSLFASAQQNQHHRLDLLPYATASPSMEEEEKQQQKQQIQADPVNRGNRQQEAADQSIPLETQSESDIEESLLNELEQEESEIFCETSSKKAKMNPRQQRETISSKSSKMTSDSQQQLSHSSFFCNDNDVSSNNVLYKHPRMSKKQTNETKNIPKNFSKAIISYIQRHPQDCANLLGSNHSFEDFEAFLVSRKERLTTIKDLRSLWTTGCKDEMQETYNRVFRIFSFKFFRENSIAYIYSSRKIKNTRALTSYRFILQRALHAPQSFSFMKLQQ